MTQKNAGILTRRAFLQASAIAAGTLALYSGELERHWVDIHRISIKINNLPDAFRGYRIAHLADFHYGEYSEPTYIRHVVRVANALKPDLFALTGDFISAYPLVRTISVDFAHHCAQLLSGLEAPLKAAVMGNHDAMVGTPEITNALASHGITVLNDNSMPIEKNGARLWLAGVADALVWPGANLKATLPKSRRSGTEPLILMAHEPDYADQVVGSGVDLILSGHTHGGQVRIPFMPLINLPPMGEKYVEGLFSIGDLQLFVTRGIGTVGVPFRFRCPPEIALITLV
jgi:predicted MPP superfamily phosphohydrolase